MRDSTRRIIEAYNSDWLEYQKIKGVDILAIYMGTIEEDCPLFLELKISNDEVVEVHGEGYAIAVMAVETVCSILSRLRTCLEAKDVG